MKLRRDPSILAIAAFRWACQQEKRLWTAKDMIEGAGLLHTNVVSRLLRKLMNMGVIYQDRTDYLKHATNPYRYFTKWQLRYDPDWELHLIETILNEKR